MSKKKGKQGKKKKGEETKRLKRKGEQRQRERRQRYTETEREGGRCRERDRDRDRSIDKERNRQAHTNREIKIKSRRMKERKERRKRRRGAHEPRIWEVTGKHTYIHVMLFFACRSCYLAEHPYFLLSQPTAAYLNDACLCSSNGYSRPSLSAVSVSSSVF